MAAYDEEGTLTETYMARSQVFKITNNTGSGATFNVYYVYFKVIKTTTVNRYGNKTVRYAVSGTDFWEPVNGGGYQACANKQMGTICQLGEYFAPGSRLEPVQN